MENVVLGYDCDGIELFEFDIIRAIWYSYIDFSKQTNIDPRQYCVVKSSNGKVYLISVFDHWNKKAINRFEGRDLNSNVPIKIKSIDESIHYEKAYDCYGKDFTYKFNKIELIKTLTKNLI